MSGGEMVSGLLEKSKELDQLRKEQDKTLLAINSILKKLQSASATSIKFLVKRKADDYLLEFDDDEEDRSLPQRNALFHRVVPLPEGHRQ